MQLIIPTIHEEKTIVTGGAPAALQPLLLPGMQAQFLQGGWGHALVQTMARHDYTWWQYDFHIKGDGIMLHARASWDAWSLFVVAGGNVAGFLTLDTWQATLAQTRQRVRNRLALPAGDTSLIKIDLKGPETSPVFKPVFLSRPSLLRLHGLNEEMHKQKVPGLFLDGLVAALLKDFYLRQADAGDEALLAGAPFHFTAADLEKVRKAKALVDGSVHQRLPLAQLAREAGTNTDLLKKGFKYVYGETMHRYWLSISLDHAKELIETTGRTVKEVAAACGFSHYSHFIQQFKNRFGVPPGQLRK